MGLQRCLMAQQKLLLQGVFQFLGLFLQLGLGGVCPSATGTGWGERGTQGRVLKRDFKKCLYFNHANLKAKAAPWALSPGPGEAESPSPEVLSPLTTTANVHCQHLCFSSKGGVKDHGFGVER